jgi:hypothetical protein
MSCTASAGEYCDGDFSFKIDDNDNVCFCTVAEQNFSYDYASSEIYMSNITQISGSYRIGDPSYQYTYADGY